MHDPMTVAFDIQWPWKNGSSIATIWHVDPERDGSDDSCGWFMRARHGDKETLEAIVSAFEVDWDRVFRSDSGRVYFTGLFTPNGEPHFSVPSVTLQLFFAAARVVFKSDGHTNWKRAKRFMRRHLLDILLLAENPNDSLHDSLTRKFEIGCGETYDKAARDSRIREIARIIYGWILRAEQRWWQHPRWHVHHWKIQIHAVQHFKRWMFSRCQRCGGRFRWGESPCSNSWNGTGPLWFRSEQHVYHFGCVDENTKL